MAFFVLLGVILGFPAAAYRRTPSCPALQGLQTFACPAIARFRATADAAPVRQTGFRILLKINGLNLLRTKIACL